MIDLGIDNKINQNNETKDEIGELVKELQNSLTKEEFTTTLNMEILNEITLATKYKEQLDDIINKYMEELSYEYDFLYFDYDKKEESYYFDLYLDGERTREYLSKDDAKGMESKNGTLWRIWDEDSIFESEDLKDNIKINIECEIDMLDWKSKNGK
mgnify:FL=1